MRAWWFTLRYSEKRTCPVCRYRTRVPFISGDWRCRWCRVVLTTTPRASTPIHISRAVTSISFTAMRITQRKKPIGLTLGDMEKLDLKKLEYP